MVSTTAVIPHMLSFNTPWLYTHTHPFKGHFSGTTRVSQYQKSKANLDFTEARDSGISLAVWKSAPRSRQITTPAPHRSVFTGWIPFLPPNQQHQSTEGTCFVLLIREKGKHSMALQQKQQKITVNEKRRYLHHVCECDHRLPHCDCVKMFLFYSEIDSARILCSEICCVTGCQAAVVSVACDPSQRHAVQTSHHETAENPSRHARGTARRGTHNVDDPVTTGETAGLDELQDDLLQNKQTMPDNHSVPKDNLGLVRVMIFTVRSFLCRDTFNYSQTTRIWRSIL